MAPARDGLLPTQWEFDEYELRQADKPAEHFSSFVEAHARAKSLHEAGERFELYEVSDITRSALGDAPCGCGNGHVKGRACSPVAKAAVLSRLLEAWKAAPTLRLGQLLYLVSVDAQLRDIFDVEDERLVELAEAYAKRCVSADAARKASWLTPAEERVVTKKTEDGIEYEDEDDGAETRSPEELTALVNACLPEDMAYLQERGASTLEIPLAPEDLIFGDVWECDKSPTGRCVYHPGSDPGDCDECIYCLMPEERK